MGSEGEAFEGSVIRVGEAWVRGGSRGERSVGGNREAGGGWGPARGRDALSQSVEVPVCCGKGERGKLPTMVGVKRGIPWIYPRERARRKVEREGEPKLR